MNRSSKPERRSVKLCVCLTEAEEQKLEELAQQAHMSRQAYVRTLLFRKLPAIVKRTPLDENWCREIMDKLNAVFTKQCSQEITLREADVLTDELKNQLSESFQDIHEVCVDLEERLGV